VTLTQHSAYESAARYTQPFARRLASPALSASSGGGSEGLAQSHGLSAFGARLSTLCGLSTQEASMLKGFDRLPRSHPPQTEIKSDAAGPASRIMVSGWACRQRVLSDGRRQITSFILPGDIVGGPQQPEPPLDYSIMAVTQVVTVDASALMAAVAGTDPIHRRLARAVRLLGQHEMISTYNQIVRLGRQTAYERMVHLMLELHERLRIAGKAGSDAFPLPLTQEVLSDALGLSVVHVNRTMRQLKRDGLLEVYGGRVKILDLNVMREIADWIPAHGARQ